MLWEVGSLATATTVCDKETHSCGRAIRFPTALSSLQGIYGLG